MARHSARRIPASRRTAAVVAVVAIAVAGVVVSMLRGHDPLVRPADTCVSAPPLRTVEGVTLQPAAMKAYRRAQRLAHGRISVVQSYRSCGEQAAACRNICGNADGCPGTCASPGSSYHQLGAAIDVTQGTLDTPGVIGALRRAGWCESEPGTDPGHFSFDGCH